MENNVTGERLGKSNYEMLANFRYVLRRFLRTSELNARAAGVTSQQYQALLAIRGYPERDYVRIGELAERLQLTHNATVELVDRMEAQELITRFSGMSDRRQVCVALTPGGRQSLEKAALANQEQLRCLSPDLMTALQQLMNAPAFLIKDTMAGEAGESMN